MVVNVERPPETRAQARNNLGGVLLDRPFRIRRLGHFGVTVDKVEECLHFYSDLLGIMVSDEVDFGGRLSPERRARLGADASAGG
jgi:hypothetical protein